LHQGIEFVRRAVFGPSSTAVKLRNFVS